MMSSLPRRRNGVSTTPRQAGGSHRLAGLPAVLLAVALAGAWQAPPAFGEGGPGEGTDLEIGGPGGGPGQFLELRDITFGPQNRLYTLEGRRFDNKENRWVGNCRVQIFENDGKFVEQFPVAVEGLDEKHDPAKIVVDGRGQVFVSEPVTGVVLQFRRNGPWDLAAKHDAPDAHALCLWNAGGREHVAVMARRREQREWVAIDQLQRIDAAQGKLLEPLRLSRGVAEAMDMTADAQGNLYVLGEVNQLYKFRSSGELAATVGAGTFRRTQDGSELRHSAAVDPEGRVHVMTWSPLAVFSPALDTVALAKAQFYWYDAWSPHGAPTIVAFDENGRFWVGTTGQVAHGQRHHFRPAVIRLKPDYFKDLKPTTTRVLGFDPVVATDLPYHVAHDLKPIRWTYTVKASHRQVHDIAVRWHVYDVYRNEVAGGAFDLALVDGEEASREFGFTPPRFGWYAVECHAAARDGEPLIHAGLHLGVTPAFAGLAVMADGESPGGWVDPLRHAFCGLNLLRIHTGQGAEPIDKALDDARRHGLTLLVQLENKEQCRPEQVREFVEKFKGRVRYWEIVNEPNLSMSAADYGTLVNEVAPLIRKIDPAARVMGPAVCGINLSWIEEFLKTGAGKHLDIVSVHDYEGNESIDPDHWRWKIGELRALMKRFDLAARPVWQTERAIGGVRAGNFLGGVQAVRMTLHRDVMETLAVPNEQNLHYYVNQAGYSAVPTYVWSSSGPHPAALALRTREAMVRGRRYAGTLDFGPHGNDLFMALRYRGGDGETIVLRQLGASEDLAVELGVSGDGAVEVVDSFGNRRQAAVRDGKLALRVPALPLYLRLEAGRQATAPKLDFGRNLAAEATFTFSGETESDPAVLADGLMQNTHAGSPWGAYFKGSLATAPQTLEMALPEPRKVHRVEVFSMRADNPHSYLIDFDLEYHDGQKWVALKQVRTPIPPSALVRTADSRANTWYMDQNFAVIEFPAVETDRLRIVAHRSTHGFHPDPTATEATGWQANGQNLHLREIRVFGPPGT